MNANPAHALFDLAHLHLAPKVRQQISPGQSDAAPSRAAPPWASVAANRHSPARAKQRALPKRVMPFQGDQAVDRFDTQGGDAASAASLCPGLICCRTFGAKCIPHAVQNETFPWCRLQPVPLCSNTVDGLEPAPRESFILDRVKNKYPTPKPALWVLILFLATLCPRSTIAQPPNIDPPIVGRPDGFSNIVGKYDIQASAEPTDVRVEEPITLRIRITGSGPEKYEPDRKHLQLFSGWDENFYVQEMRDEHQIERDKRTWLFVYRLKPKHAKLNAIDGIKLVYYDPSIAGKKKFVTRFVEPIKITVKPKRADPGPVTVLAAPESFYEHAASADVLTGTVSPFALSGGALAAVLLAVPCVCLIGAFAWRRLFPDKRGLKERRRSQAAERALADLRAGSGSPWAVVCRYLRQRLDFAARDATPREVARFLKRRGFALERCAQGQAFLQACDAVRYTGGVAPDGKSLADEAATLIQTLEADPCVH